MLAAVGTSSQAMWYLVRATGLVDLVLFSIVMALGVSQVVRFTRPGWSQLVISGLHRNLSLLAVALLGIHIVTSVLDTFVSISVANVFIPFGGSYRPLYLGLGALALDVALALVFTSLVRSHLGRAAWRAVHWAAYACWPLAVAHGLGMGTDAGLHWVDALNAACIVLVGGAVAWRAWATANGLLSRPGRPVVSGATVAFPPPRRSGRPPVGTGARRADRPGGPS